MCDNTYILEEWKNYILHELKQNLFLFIKIKMTPAHFTSCKEIYHNNKQLHFIHETELMNILWR